MFIATLDYLAAKVNDEDCSKSLKLVYNQQMKSPGLRLVILYNWDFNKCKPIVWFIYVKRLILTGVDRSKF